jgi:hypothetical protein
MFRFVTFVPNQAQRVGSDRPGHAACQAPPHPAHRLRPAASGRLRADALLGTPICVLKLTDGRPERKLCTPVGTNLDLPLLLRPATTNITPPNRAAQPLAGLPLRRPRGTLSETAALGAIRQRSRSELCLRRRESRAAHAERLPPCSSPRAGLRSRTEPRRCYRNRAGHRPRTRRRTTTPATPTRRPRLAYVPVPLLPEGRLMRWWWCACRTNPDQYWPRTISPVPVSAEDPQSAARGAPELAQRNRVYLMTAVSPVTSRDQQRDSWLRHARSRNQHR